MSPADRFIASPHKLKHQAWVESAAEDAIDAALCEYFDSLPFGHDGPDAAANFFRLEGARQFARILLRLHLPPEPRKPNPLTATKLKPPQ